MRSTRSKVTGWLVLLTLLYAAQTEQSSAAAAKGPLRVHPDNPRHFTDGAGKLYNQVELYRWVDFPIDAPGAADNIARWDVEGSCLWTHESGAQRTSLLWYSGSGDTYVYRFGGSFQGRWTGTTTSPVPELDGLTLTVNVLPSGNANRIGWSGQMADEPTAWAHQRGPDGTLVKRTPILIMMPDVRRWHEDLDAMRAFVAEFNDGHGFNGGHIGWEHWYTMTSDNAIDAGLAAVPDRPMMSEDRFRRRDGAWPQKDMRSDDDILTEIPRWATRGVATIYGRLLDGGTEASDIWPNKAAIKSIIESIDE